MYFRGAQIILLTASVDNYKDSISRCVYLIKQIKSLGG